MSLNRCLHWTNLIHTEKEYEVYSLWDYIFTIKDLIDTNNVIQNVDVKIRYEQRVNFISDGKVMCERYTLIEYKFRREETNLNIMCD